MIRWLAVIGLASAASAAPARVDHADVDTGSLVRSPAEIRIDVVIPAGGDLPRAVESARVAASNEALLVVDTLLLLVIELTNPDLAAALRAF